MDLLAVRGLTTQFRTGRGLVKAVDAVSFSVRSGEILGLIGESGCGKSTVGLSIMRLIEPPGEIVAGEILFNGDDMLAKPMNEFRKIRWSWISYIPQSAMNGLDPVYPVEWQIVEAVRAHLRVSKADACDRATELLERVGIGKRRGRSYPHQMSGGMKQRAVIAMALACRPSLVIADESTTGLDVMTQAQVLRLIKELQTELGLSLVFISHDLPLVKEICDRVVVMYAGRLVEICAAEKLDGEPLHPYTRGLMGAFVDLRQPVRPLLSIPGNVPNLMELPAGCAFEPRCDCPDRRCREVSAELVEVEKDHWLACCCRGGCI